MSATVLILLLAGIAPGAAVLIVFCRLHFGAALLPPTTAWIDEFAIERYGPMLRLLDESDVRLLRACEGMKPRDVRQFRRERCRIFHGYLRSMAEDFRRVLAALRLVMTQANSDRPDLAALLIRSQVRFAACMVLAQLQLALYGFGIGTVQTSELLKVFEGMRLELRTLVPAAGESRA